mmetsp:Transcript_43840/g.80064  ORF Transcript_43840/g.80064 Transcript_43840/m.80064 type:complete len:250 (+) Transcript_43840:85-834(+)
MLLSISLEEEDVILDFYSCPDSCWHQPCCSCLGCYCHHCCCHYSSSSHSEVWLSPCDHGFAIVLGILVARNFDFVASHAWNPCPSPEPWPTCLLSQASPCRVFHALPCPCPCRAPSPGPSPYPFLYLSPLLSCLCHPCHFCPCHDLYRALSPCLGPGAGLCLESCLIFLAEQPLGQESVALPASARTPKDTAAAGLPQLAVVLAHRQVLRTVAHSLDLQRTEPSARGQPGLPSGCCASLASKGRQGLFH